jgi:Fur family transcriptional regulator, peroxide stress response regulator
MQNTSEFLKNHSIRPSYQRIRIYDYLTSMRNHPTIDMIYSSLIREIPSLSKTTIYNTLRLFVETGIVNPVTIEDHEIRYDADIRPHIHFKCTLCGAIDDMRLSEDWTDIASMVPEGYQINEEHLYLRGYCPSCREKISS